MTKSDRLMSFLSIDYEHMARALRLAERGVYTTDPNPNVGCVIVAGDGTVAGEGWHERAGQGHAEVLALAQAGDRAAGATVYVTLEPCSHHGRTPPCADALIAAGVARVVCAMEDPNPQVAGQGKAALEQSGIRVQSGLMAAAARELNRGFVARMERGRPWLRVKLAVSADGRTAMASGESKWITGEAARADVHRLRARSSAILTGIGTVLADDPQLNARCAEPINIEQPLRVVADSSLRLNHDAKIIGADGKARVYFCSANDDRQAALEAEGVTLVKAPESEGRVCLKALLEDLAAAGVNDVLVEAGPALNGRLLEAGLVDEVVVYQSARIMGAAARGMFDLPAVATMDESIKLQLCGQRFVGDDLRLTYRMA
jgi:diaminohydroxyphosphoribosylaminopyrimidine deaminase/5-amino-6-(5-phosphoribosylamino)uracil reductase